MDNKTKEERTANIIADIQKLSDTELHVFVRDLERELRLVRALLWMRR